MAAKTPAAALTDFSRGGTRSYAEAKDVLKAWAFVERRTSRGHSFWHHTRGVTLTITMKRVLPAPFKALIIKKIKQIQLRD